jgi:hypothetical protein
MARNFLAFPFAPYNGTYTSKPFNTSRGKQKGEMVACDVLWPSYQANGQPLGDLNPNFTVIVNLNASGPNQVNQNWTIQSVYIDNDGVDFPVYVFFPDTLFTVSVPANSSGWLEVYTISRQAFIAGVGITSASINNLQRTRVFFTDVLMTPYLDEEAPSVFPNYIGSNKVQRTGLGQSGFGPPALGDNFFQVSQVLTAGNQNIVQFGPFPNQFLYITEVTALMYDLQNDGTANTGQVVVDIANDIDGVVFQARGNSSTSTALATSPPCIILDVHGNFRFPTTRNWITQNTSTSLLAGKVIFSFSFSINNK